jgi:RND family efflux transporter MFP subunit
VISPSRSAPRTEILLPGSTAALHDTAVYARTDGYLSRLMVDIGDRVQEGQLLAEIEAPEVDQQWEHARTLLQQAHADLTLKQARAKLAVINFERARRLIRRMAASQQELDEAEANLGISRADVAAAEAAIRTAEAEVGRLEKLRSFQRVTAPFAGVVTVRNVDKGAMINAGGGSGRQPLFRIVRADTLRVFVNAPQAASSAVKAVGLAAQVLCDEYPGEAFDGRVARAAGEVDEASRTMKVEVRLPNPGGRLSPGMFVRVKFLVDRPFAPLKVPAGAVARRSDGPHVAVVPPDGRVRYRPVTLGRDYGPEVEILTGLSGDERIVATPSPDLREGGEVTAVAAEGAG